MWTRTPSFPNCLQLPILPLCSIPQTSSMIQPQLLYPPATLPPWPSPAQIARLLVGREGGGGLRLCWPVPPVCTSGWYFWVNALFRRNLFIFGWERAAVPLLRGASAPWRWQHFTRSLSQDREVGGCSPPLGTVDQGVAAHHMQHSSGAHLLQGFCSLRKSITVGRADDAPSPPHPHDGHYMGMLRADECECTGRDGCAPQKTNNAIPHAQAPTATAPVSSLPLCKDPLRDATDAYQFCEAAICWSPAFV